MRRHVRASIGIAVVCSFFTGGPIAGAAGCPNASIRAQQHSTFLPECRAYEMVSPLDKLGGEPAITATQARIAADGDATVFVSADSFADSEASPQLNYYRAQRTTDGWSTNGLSPRQPVAPEEILTGGTRYLGWSPDLTIGVARNWGPLTADSPVGAGSLYRQVFPSGGYQLMTPLPLDVSPLDYIISKQSAVAGGSGDFGHILFEASKQLTPDAAPGVTNLYEWTPAGVRLAGVLPASEGGGAPGGGTAAGTGATSVGETFTKPPNYTDRTISEDGARIFFTTPPKSGLDGIAEGDLYVREDGTSTTKMSASQRTDCAITPGSCSGVPEPDPEGPSPARFWTSTPDGGKAFFTSAEDLTDESRTGTGTGKDLYRFDVETGELLDLSTDESSTEGARVLGVLGTSGDGERVYFAAAGMLAPGAIEGEANLYLWDRGQIEHIATGLAPNPGAVLGEEEEPNWSVKVSAFDSEPNERVARVSSDGDRVMFLSRFPITGYDNAGTDQLYVFDADSDSLRCVSCPLSGQPPSASIGRGAREAGFETTPQAYLQRRLSEDGSKVFFDTPDPLVPEDTNGVLDVYQYTSATGPVLISDGKSREPAQFADASSNGDSVLFHTRARLVGSDRDLSSDLYVARIGGGFAEPTTRSPCEGESCRVQPTAVPPYAAPVAASGGAGQAKRRKSARVCRRVRRSAAKHPRSRALRSKAAKCSKGGRS